jgi:hypothetical protein
VKNETIKATAKGTIGLTSTPDTAKNHSLTPPQNQSGIGVFKPLLTNLYELLRNWEAQNDLSACVFIAVMLWV